MTFMTSDSEIAQTCSEIEVPQLPLDQIQQRMVAVWLGSFYGSSGYVGKKLGKKGLKEFSDLGARQVAATFKRLNLTEADQIAQAIATNDKNLFGTEVEVKTAGGKAEIVRTRCALLEGAKALSRVGASMIAKEHCKTCVEGHWRKVFSNLGMNLETLQTECGCVMRIFKP